MPLSSLASLCQQDAVAVDPFYLTPCFQAFVAGVEETLEEQLTEFSAIAISRAGATASNILCNLALEALRANVQEKVSITAIILRSQQ